MAVVRSVAATGIYRKSRVSITISAKLRKGSKGKYDHPMNAEESKSWRAQRGHFQSQDQEFRRLRDALLDGFTEHGGKFHSDGARYWLPAGASNEAHDIAEALHHFDLLYKGSHLHNLIVNWAYRLGRYCERAAVRAHEPNAL